MLHLIAATILLLNSAKNFEPRLTRQEFVARLSRLNRQENLPWTKERVRKLLGRPDDVWPPNDDARYVEYGEEVWCYGTHGHHSMPLLGRVRFAPDGIVKDVVGWGKAPPAEIIGEAELVATLRLMFDRAGKTLRPNNLYAFANLLIAKGQTKTVAILGEYRRICEFVGMDDWLYWLAHAVFASTQEGGIFGVSKYERYLGSFNFNIIVDDVVFWLPSMGAGHGGLFFYRMDQNVQNWVIRTKPLRPPDDPFPTYFKVISSGTWPFPKEEIGFENNPRKGWAMMGILSAVSTAYRPSEAGQATYDKQHQEFLELGCYWSPLKNAYVRGDGSMIEDKQVPEPKAHLQSQYKFKTSIPIDFDIVYSRQDEHTLRCQVNYTHRQTQPLTSAVLRIENPDTGAEIAWTEINRSREPKQPVRTLAETLEATKHLSSNPGSVQIFPKVAPGTRVRYVILYQDKRFESPVIQL